MKSSRQNEKIIAYAFEKLGLPVPNEELNIGSNITLEFHQFDSGENLDSAKGVIIPQGIFEHFQEIRSYFENGFRVRVNESLLLDRERQISNILRSGGWICFLVGEISDYITGTGNIRDTDLCKRVLNLIGVTDRKIVKGTPYLDVKRDEFRLLIEKYGVAKTCFEYIDGKEECTILITSGYNTVGFEFSRKIYFLPIHIISNDEKDAVELASITVKSIFEYRQKNIIEHPNWLNDFKFSFEEQLLDEWESISIRQTKIQSILLKYKDYKAILVSSGDPLKDLLIDIFSNYFAFNIDAEENSKEDFKILKSDNTPIVFVEVKGTKKGLKREYINQVDSHRERAGFDSNFPGLLIINNEMSIEGYTERFNKELPEEQIIHAKKMNVLVMRTIDLLFLMKMFEENDDRSKVLLSHISNDNGWLRVSEKEIELI